MTQTLQAQDETQRSWHDLPTDVLVLAFSCPGVRQHHLYTSLPLVCRGWRKAALAACRQQLLLVLDGHRLQPWSDWVQRYPGCLRSLSIRCWRVLGHQAEAQALSLLTSTLCSLQNLQQLSLERFPVATFPASLTHLKLRGLHILPTPRHQQQLQGLSSLQQLEYLAICGVTPRLPHAALLALTPLCHLTHLTLSSCELSNDSPLHALPSNLQSLVLSHHPDLDTLPSLAHLPHLEELVLDHLGYPMQLPLADVAGLSSLRHFSAAKAASAAPLYIPEDTAVLLGSGGGAMLAAGLSSNSSSSRAAAGGSYVQLGSQLQQGAGSGAHQGATNSSSSSSLEDWVWRWCTGRLRGLTSLRLEGYNISAVALQASGCLPNLRQLSLGPLNLAAVDAMAAACPCLCSCRLTLAPPPPRTLQQLQLVDPLGLASLVAITSLRKLDLISVPKNQLSALGALRQLTWLQISNLEVGAAGEAMKQVAGLTRLQHLWLLGDGVRAGGMVQLCAALQHLTALRLQLQDKQWVAGLEAASAQTGNGSRPAAAGSDPTAASDRKAGGHNSPPRAAAATAPAAAGARSHGLLACLQQLSCLQQLDLGLGAGQHKLLAAALQLPGVDEIKL